MSSLSVMRHVMAARVYWPRVLYPPFAPHSPYRTPTFRIAHPHVYDQNNCATLTCRFLAVATAQLF